MSEGTGAENFHKLVQRGVAPKGAVAVEGTGQLPGQGYAGGGYVNGGYVFPKRIQPF
jgi:uncharacterized membrane protein